MPMKKWMAVLLMFTMICMFSSTAMASEKTETAEFELAIEQTIDMINSGEYSALYVDKDGSVVEEYRVILPSGKEVVSEIRVEVVRADRTDSSDGIMMRAAGDWTNESYELRVGDVLNWSFTWNRGEEGYLLGGMIQATASIRKESISELNGIAHGVYSEPPAGYFANSAQSTFLTNNSDEIEFRAWAQFNLAGIIPIKYTIDAVFSCSPHTPWVVSCSKRASEGF